MNGFEHRLPDARLRPFVKMYFSGVDDMPPEVQRIVPNGEMGLLFFRRGKVLLDGTDAMRCCIKGQSARYHDIVSPGGGIGVVGANFTLLGARLFLKTPLRHFYEKSVELTDIDDPDFRVLEAKIMTSETSEECWRLMDGFFLRRMHLSGQEIPDLKCLQHAIAYGLGSPPDARVGDMALHACRCERQLGRMFSEFIGLPPKEFLRIMRFRQALTAMKHLNGGTTMDDMAIHNGWYDYSHMSSDFRRITGYPPVEFMKVSKGSGDRFGWRL